MARWAPNAGGEKKFSQSHFNDLCALVGVPTPHEADPSGESYCFEKAVSRASGGDGFADVWRRGFFGWEYKGRYRDLAQAYRQVLDYRADLENPPLLVVSDIERIVIHTDFTNTKTQVHEVTLDDLADPARRPEALRVLRALMTDPEALRPKQTPDQVTEAAAERFALIARSLQERGHEAEAVAHFLNRVLFCLFAEDVGLLPRRLMTDLIESRSSRPGEFTEGLADLFAHMSSREESRYFGNARIEWFNGGCSTGRRWWRSRARSWRRCGRLRGWTGRRWSLRSWGRCSSGDWTRRSGGSWGRTTRTRRRSRWWWNRWCWSRCAGSSRGCGRGWRR